MATSSSERSSFPLISRVLPTTERVSMLGTAASRSRITEGIRQVPTVMEEPMRRLGVPLWRCMARSKVL